MFYGQHCGALPETHVSTLLLQSILLNDDDCPLDHDILTKTSM